MDVYVGKVSMTLKVEEVAARIDFEVNYESWSCMSQKKRKLVMHFLRLVKELESGSEVGIDNAEYLLKRYGK